MQDQDAFIDTKEESLLSGLGVHNNDNVNDIEAGTTQLLLRDDIDRLGGSIESASIFGFVDN